MRFRTLGLRSLSVSVLSATLTPLLVLVPTVTPAGAAPEPVEPVEPSLATVGLTGVDPTAARAAGVLSSSQRAAAAGTSGRRVLALSGQLRTKPSSTVAVTWADQAEPAQVEVSVRVRSARGWSDWHKLGGQNDAGVNPGAPEVRGRVIRDGTAPLWVGDSDGVQARVDAVAGPAPRDLRTGTNRPRA